MPLLSPCAVSENHPGVIVHVLCYASSSTVVYGSMPNTGRQELQYTSYVNCARLDVAKSSEERNILVGTSISGTELGSA